jgi:hypothetical protein
MAGGFKKLSRVRAPNEDSRSNGGLPLLMQQHAPICVCS